MKRPIPVLFSLSLMFLGIHLGAEENRIFGEPVGSNIINRSSYSSVKPALVLIHGDRIGGRATLCKTYSDTPCDEQNFLFPQLRLDRAKNLVLYAKTPVATYRSHGDRITPTKEYRLRCKTVPKLFNKETGRTVDTLQIFLEHR